MKSAAFLVGLLIPLLVLAPAPAGAGPTANVTIIDFAFIPSSVTVDFDPDGGNQVTFTYVPDGLVMHNIHGDVHNNEVNEGACMAMSEVIEPGESTTVTITLGPLCLQAIAHSQGVSAQGPVVKYHCHIHSGMRGQVVLRVV